LLNKGSTSVVTLDAAGIALECGDIRAVNIVLIGVMAGLGLGGISRELWEDSVKRLVPQKALEINIKAFDRGYERGSCR
jgi:indolepyruvate ferredoxin oxidoreductase beta subunit